MTMLVGSGVVTTCREYNILDMEGGIAIHTVQIPFVSYVRFKWIECAFDLFTRW